MPNTGKKIIITVKQVGAESGTPSGQVENNDYGDPWYIAPVTDTVACPITYSTSCPVILSTGHSAQKQVEYEFSLPSAVRNNPNIAQLRILLNRDGVEWNTIVLNPPFAAYYGGRFSADDMGSPLSSGTYNVALQYMDAANATLNYCNAPQVAI